MMVKGWLGGLGMGGQSHIDLIEDMVSVGSGGRFGNGRANIYILENTAMDKSRLEKGGWEGWEWEGKYIHRSILDNTAMNISRLEKGGVGGLGMGGQRHGFCWERREVWEWEGKCIQLGKYSCVKYMMEKGWVGGLGGQMSEGFLT